MRIMIGILIGVSVVVFVPGGVLATRWQHEEQMQHLQSKMADIEHKMFRISAEVDRQKHAILKFHADDMKDLMIVLDMLTETVLEHANDLNVLRRESPGLKGGEGVQ